MPAASATCLGPKGRSSALQACRSHLVWHQRAKLPSRKACPFPRAYAKHHQSSQRLDDSSAHGQAGAAVLASFLMWTCFPDSAHATVIQGPARVSDGDTLVIGDQRIRLYGVDAPEKAQLCKNATGLDYPCGQISKEALTAKVGNKVVNCEVKNTDQYGRNVAQCSVGGGLLGAQEDLGTYMVQNGLAVAYRQYSKDYIPIEESAKAARVGIWQGSFTTPADWRKEQKAAGPAPSSPLSIIPLATNLVIPANTTSTCPGGAAPIKGNIGSSGDKIYHVPGGRYYEQVKIELDQGEKYFCSEQEALAAGWRASKQ